MDRMELLQRFRALPTGNLADAMVKLGLPCHTVTGLTPLSPTQERAAGYAVTIRQMERNVSADAPILTRHADVIDHQLQAGDLLVIDVGGRDTPCTGGALLALRAKTLGVSGFLVNGCLRDLHEIAALGFPVHLKGGCPIKSSPRLETVSIDSPVEINGTQIVPGDLIVMDETGIVVLPVAHAQEICEEAEKIFALESRAETFIRQGHGVLESLQLAAM